MSTIKSFIPIIMRNLRNVLLSFAMFGIATACRSNSSESDDNRSSVQVNKKDVGNLKDREEIDDISSIDDDEVEDNRIDSFRDDDDDD